MNNYLNILQNIVKKLNGISIVFNNDISKQYSVIKSDRKIEFFGNLYRYFSNIIDESETFLFQNSNHLDCNLKSIINRFENVRNDYFRSEWCLKNKNILAEINKNNFLVSKKYIVYHKTIPLHSILFKQQYYTLTDKIRKENNLYIKSVKILISNTLNTVIVCNGVHPNINPQNKHFCVDYDIRKLDLNLNSLNMLIQSMRFAVIDTCYDYNIYSEIFKPLAKERVN